MSESMNIFVCAQEDMEVFTKDIASVLGIKLRLASEGEEAFYEFSDQHVVFTLGEHDFENDRDLNFSDYRYWISVRASDGWGWKERESRRDDFTRLVFEKLKATQRYSLMLVKNLQVKLEEFRPGSITSR